MVQSTVFAAASPTRSDWPSSSRAWATTIILMVVYALAFVDRQILTLLVEPIKRDLEITDTQFSLLAGLAFTLFYTLMGIPLAWVADRSSRRNMIIASIMSWSVMTALCGFATNFWTLFLARIGVGIGEAGLSPAAYSMLSDSFPPAKRARPLGVYAIGAMAGAGLALIIGGVVIQWANTATVTLPIVGTLKAWHAAFIAVSLPGPILALILLAVREPKRQSDGAKAVAAAEPLLPFLQSRAAVFSLMSLGYSLIGLPIVAYMTWTPAFLMRSYGWDVAQVGLVFGLILLVCNTAGLLIGGWWADRMTGLGRKDGVLRVVIIGAALGVPFALILPFASTGLAASGILAVMFLAFGLVTGMPAVSFQAIAPNRLRARVFALYLLIGNLIAHTSGPTLVALISDRWFKDAGGIGVAAAIVAAIMIPLGMLVLLFTRPFYVRAVENLAADGT